MDQSAVGSRSHTPPVRFPESSGRAAGPGFAEVLAMSDEAESRNDGRSGAGSGRLSAGGYHGDNVNFLPGTSPDWHGFKADPYNFARNFLLNTLTPYSSFTPLPSFTPGQVSNGENAIVGYTISPNRNDPKTGDLHILGAPGSTPRISQGFAYFVPYTNGKTNGVSVPTHPTAGQPQIVLTGALSGCGFYASPDPDNPDNTIFSHSAEAMHGGSSDVPPGSVGVDYRQHYGHAGAASAFAFYDGHTQRWMIAGQNATLGHHGTQQVAVGGPGNPGGHSGVLIPVTFAGGTSGRSAGVASDPPRDVE
jgi:hypothetical protein